MVSSDFGQLAVSRHLTSGVDWAMAGAASAEAAMPAAPTLRNSRRFMDSFLLIQGPGLRGGPSCVGLEPRPACFRLDMAPLAARARKKPATHRLTYGAGMTSEPAAGTLSAVGSCTQESKSGTHRTSTRYPCASLSTTLSRFRRIRDVVG